MIDPTAVARMAADYTAAWNSKSPEAVASFYAADGEIVINKGEPWSGRDRVRDMAAGFYADVPDLTLSCDDTAAQAITPSMSGLSPATTPPQASR